KFFTNHNPTANGTTTTLIQGFITDTFKQNLKAITFTENKMKPNAVKLLHKICKTIHNQIWKNRCKITTQNTNNDQTQQTNSNSTKNTNQQNTQTNTNNNIQQTAQTKWEKWTKQYYMYNTSLIQYAKCNLSENLVSSLSRA
ncbi:3521_t:CDS:1, partial [Racocetra persica]